MINEKLTWRAGDDTEKVYSKVQGLLPAPDHSRDTSDTLHRTLLLLLHILLLLREQPLLSSHSPVIRIQPVKAFTNDNQEVKSLDVNLDTDNGSC